MKIVVFQDRLRSGGTERQTILLANAFAAAGHSATLLTCRPHGVLAPTLASNVAHHALQPLDTHLDWFAPGLIRAVAEAAPDIVLCMGRIANCYAGHLQDRFPRVAVIATMRTGKKLPWLFRRSLQRTRHIVANSNEARTHLIARHRVAPERATTIANSLLFPVQAPAGTREQIRAAQGASDATFVLLCVAMFRPEKNQRELIEIVAQLPASLDWQLWLVGDGEARGACEDLVAKKSLFHRVKFLGWQRDPAPFYAAADLAVHASWSEALSNFLIEAQAHGLPAIAYDAQGIAECFIPDDTGFIIARDQRTAFREKVVQLAKAKHPETSDRAHRARQHAHTSFGHDQQVARYLDLFTKLTSTDR